MKLLKYPAMIIAVLVIIIVIFYEDIKKLFQKVSTMTQVKFNKNKNNPFNIRAVKANKWNGKTTPEGAEFESFDTLENGVRAGIKILLTYFNKYNLRTIEKIISRYAPDNENNTAGYIDFVANETGFEPNQAIEPNKENLWKLSHAICKMENGYELKKNVYEKAFAII